MAKIHRLLGAEVGQEQVFAAEPGYGPWLVDGPALQISSGGAGAGGGWKDVVGGWGRKKDGSEQAQLVAAEGETDGGREREVEGGGLGGATAGSGGDRMEGVKRNAKLNNVSSPSLHDSFLASFLPSPKLSPSFNQTDNST